MSKNYAFRDVSAGYAEVVDSAQGITRGYVTRNNGGSQEWRVWVPSGPWADHSGSESTVRHAVPLNHRAYFRTRNEAAEWLIDNEGKALAEAKARVPQAFGVAS